MLKPKAEIGIVYGHNDALQRAAIDAIAKMAAEGYRVRSRILTPTELKRENTSVFDALLSTFRSLNAALVFMTADDRGLSENELANLPVSHLSGKEIIERLHPRSRQNVNLELGFLIGTLGHKLVRLFGPRNLEYPSDINGMYISAELTPQAVEDHVRQIVEERLGLKRVAPPLRDVKQRQSYADLSSREGNTLVAFEHEYERIEENDDRLMYLLERIVFESYFQAEPNDKWWSRRVAMIIPNDDVQDVCKRLLRHVTDYMASWRPPDYIDPIALESCASGLQRIVEELKTLQITPMAHIIAFDYLGLALDKIARQSTVPNKQREELLSNASSALNTCIHLASKYDDENLQLWKGYALFNLARVEQRREANDSWRPILREAVAVRNSWQRAGYDIPHDLEEGLITECFHATAILAELDETLGEEFVQQQYKEYEKWRGSARNRVRLARNVAETWARIHKRHPT